MAVVIFFIPRDANEYTFNRSIKLLLAACLLRTKIATLAQNQMYRF